MQKEDITITEEEIKRAIQIAPNKKSTGPDNICILHLKHLGPIAIKHLSKLFTITINRNIIPQIWKLAKIVPIPKPNKDKNEGKSYRPISLLSNIAKILERVILARVEQYLPKKKYQHGYKAKHSTTTALHKISQTIADGFNKKRPPQRTIMIAVDMSRAFDVINHHLLINKLINQTNTPNIFKKYLANYIQGRKAFTMWNNTKSKQRTFHGGVPQGGVLSPALFNLFMSNMPEPPEGSGLELVVYADDVTLLATHENITVAEEIAQPYLDTALQWMKDNDLILADKTQATLFTSDPAQYNHKLNLKIEDQQLETKKNPVVLGLTFDPKLNFNEHIKITEEKAKSTLKLVKAISGTDWGQQKETIASTYTQFTRPTIEYACPVWAPIASDTNIAKLQRIQNSALRSATGHTRDTNINHIHQETKVLPLQEHMHMICSQYRESARDRAHPLHDALAKPPPERNKKRSALDAEYATVVHSCDPEGEEEKERKRNKKKIHTEAVRKALEDRPVHPLLQHQAPTINKSEETLPRAMRRTLAQLRAGKSPLLRAYLHNIEAAEDPSCPLCGQEHTVEHLFGCQSLPTELTPLDLWQRPTAVAGLVGQWQAALEPAGGAEADA